jgi:glycosyltransferase involved in cell wall biosynthesis
MITEKKPKVSIGLAVYNGEKYLKAAVDSILSQTFTDFELIISDNASTDRTEAICRLYAAQDSRIRYSRNQTNIGGANNENLAFKLSCGEYFRWAAHDDVCGPELLAKLVEVLDNDPTVVLAYPQIMKIDENGNHLGIHELNQAQLDTPSARFRDLTGYSSCEEIYGLIRSEILKKTDLQLNYTDSDRSLLCELSMYGKFKQVNEILFYKRHHPEMSTRVFKDWRQRMAWFGSEFERKITLPHWMQFFHFLRIIDRSNISFGEKIRCYLYMPVWVVQYLRWRSLIKDLLLAIINGVRLGFSPKAKNV